MILRILFASAFIQFSSIPLLANPIFYSVRDFGAIGDGDTIDSPAINAAIEAAGKNGGGTVFFPAGTYASYTIRLQSRITLHLDNGATLLAAYPSADGTEGYDAPDLSQWTDDNRYQDFGHSDWRNSLIFLGGRAGECQHRGPRVDRWTSACGNTSDLASGRKLARAFEEISRGKPRLRQQSDSAQELP